MIVCYTDYDTNSPVNLIENLRENMFLTWEASVIVCLLKLGCCFLNARQENEFQIRNKWVLSSILTSVFVFTAVPKSICLELPAYMFLNMLLT